MQKKPPIRVLIVDDSSSMRQIIRMSLAADPEILVVGEAGSAREARDAVNALSPDVMTLDVEMPEMDGLEFLSRLMRARPMPVVMVSSLTERGSEAAVRALSLGAVECIAKPQRGDIAKAFGGLAATLKMAAKARIRRQVRARPTGRDPFAAANWNGKLVLIGASTGGVDAIEAILETYPEMCPPTMITQHMPAQFLASFAQRLNRRFAPTIKLAEDGETPVPGKVLISPGGATHLAVSPAGPLQVKLLEGPKQTGHRPSVDVLFSSAVPHAPKIVAAILTGMGADGAEGMRRLKEAGAFCIAQNQASCVVYGMPRVAVEKGGVDISLELSEIGPKILSLTMRKGQVEKEVQNARRAASH